MDAQDITNLLTFALAVATVWLAVATHSMAKATNAAVELQARPYLALAGLGFVIGQSTDLVSGTHRPAARIALVLSNPGQVLVNYEVEDFTVTFDGGADEEPTFETRVGVVHPKTQAEFFYPWIATTGALRPGIVGEVSFKINFWASLHHVNHFTARLRYVLQSIESPRVEWVYLEGPNYA